MLIHLPCAIKNIFSPCEASLRNMSSQSVCTPNNNSDSHDDGIGKTDLTLYGSPVQIRPNRNMRKSAPFVKMMTEDHIEHQHPGKLIRMDARRGSSFIRAMSEDQEENKGIKSPKGEPRWGSSFLKTSDEASEYSSGKSSIDIRRGSSFLKTSDDANEDTSFSSGRFSKDIRRGSSFLKTGEDTSEESFTAGKLQKDFRITSSLLKTGEEINEDNVASPGRLSKDIRRGSSFIRTADDSLDDNPQRRTDIRRGSSFIRMISEDINDEEMHSTGRLSSKSDSSRRSSAPTKSCEDSDELPSRRSSRADMRRGSSLVKTVSEDNYDVEDENTTDRSDFSEKLRKSLDISYRRSLESISEYKAKTFSSSTLYPSLDYSSITLGSPTSDMSSDFAMRSENESNKDSTDRTYVNSSLSYLSWIQSVNGDYCPPTNAANHGSDSENRTGEWNNFWPSYNNSRNEYFSSPYLCPSNSGEDLSLGSNASTPRGYTDKSNVDSIVLTIEEVNEALECTQRVMDILRGAMKRSGTEVTNSKNDASGTNNKDDQKNKEVKSSAKDKNTVKSGNSSCIDLILNHTGVAEMLKKVINKRREVIMPDEPGSRSSSECSKK